jgi:hypothetical protein
MGSRPRSFTDGELTAVMNGLAGIAGSFLKGTFISIEQFRLACGFQSASPAAQALYELGSNGSPWVTREFSGAKHEMARYTIVGAPEYRDELRAYLPEPARGSTGRRAASELRQTVADLTKRVEEDEALLGDTMKLLGELRGRIEELGRFMASFE